MKQTLLILLLIFSVSLFGQKEANIWYFGNQAGLDFNSGSPIVLQDGAMDNFEGVSSISDSDGNLLFYTNGMTIYNRNHEVMQNGNGLLGHNSSTQSGVIVPLPASNHLYYVFTVDYVYNAGDLHYSIVDISAGGGLGAVTTKNVFIQSYSAEKISAVLHANKVDIWIVIHERYNSIYKSYLLTQTGLSSSIITSETGPQLSYNGEQGCLKISPDGKYLAMATYHNWRVDICKFNNQTGQVDYEFGINYPDATYGVEFSQNSKLLYVSVSYDLSKIYQVNLATHANVQIATPAKLPGALQLGPDGKIYVARYLRPNIETKYLGVINSPELEGTDCNYVDEAIYLESGSSKMGLPTFIQSYFYYAMSISGNDVCQGDTTHFNSDLSDYLVANLEWMSWDFGDTLSNENSSTLESPTHVYKNPGVYPVTLTISSAGLVLTRSLNVTVWQNPTISLPDSSFVCPSHPLILDAGPDINNYFVWNNLNTNSTIEVIEPGTYSVIKTETMHDCSVKDTCIVIYDAYHCCDYNVQVPNFFTPNNDGINEVFKPELSGIVKYKMTITNRWGQIMFVTTDLEEGWNGKYKNEECPEGVYMVLLEYLKCNAPVFNNIEHKITALTLMR